MSHVRLCREDEFATILTIVNAAAEAYRGLIPRDQWHEPYMPAEELRREIASGVVFSGFESEGTLIGVMGIQSVRDVDLIRHAYVLPGRQRGGVGGALIEQLKRANTRPMLVGTWAAATWAIDFYQRHGFELVAEETRVKLLGTYWSISRRQMETSVVLARWPYAGSHAEAT